MSFTPELSHVGMGHEVCPVCCKEHTETVLLNTRLRKTLHQHMLTGWSMCPECNKLKQDGYVALVECSNTPSSLEDADRTGAIAHVRASVWPHLFNSPVPNKGLAFIEVGVIAKLQEKVDEKVDEQASSQEL